MCNNCVKYLSCDLDICRCQEPCRDSFIHHGNLFDEIIYYCRSCGGMIE